MDQPSRLRASLLLVVLFAAPSVVAGGQDVEGARDHPLFNRLPDYFIDVYRESEFDAYDKFVASDGSYKTVEGRKFYIDYQFQEGTEYLSEVAIKRNYKAALQKVGGVVHYEDGYNVYMSLEKDSKVTWVHVAPWNGGQHVALHIVEEEALEQYIVADADAMAEEIVLAGKVAVYGIYFDTGESVVKPESEPALVEIAKLLDRNTGMKVYVVGHTDSSGTIDYNMDLSRRRAQAVVEVLVAGHGVARSRLDPHGVGPLVPATSNRTDDGKARNRRVELVEQ